jgi:hypothetical protein
MPLTALAGILLLPFATFCAANLLLFIFNMKSKLLINGNKLLV